jgi:AmiR/NasT family two-component response regulator
MNSISPFRVLLFEDEFLLANDLKQQLRPYNFDVVAMFRKAEEGLEYLASVDATGLLPDIILMDISLAGKMTGIEAANIISRKYQIALLYITGMSQLGVFEEAFKTRPHAYLIKPFDINQTIVNIRLAIYQNTLEKQLLKYQAELEQRVVMNSGNLVLAKDELAAALKDKKNIVQLLTYQVSEPMKEIINKVNGIRSEFPELQHLSAYINDINNQISNVYETLRQILKSEENRSGNNQAI